MAFVLSLGFFLGSGPIQLMGQTPAITVQKDTLRRVTFISGHRTIYCAGCSLTFCGTLINQHGDTLDSDFRPTDATFARLYITPDNVILGSEAAEGLMRENQISSVSVMNCASGRQIYGDLAKYGVVVVELTSRFFKPIAIADYILRILVERPQGSIAVYIDGLRCENLQLKIAEEYIRDCRFDAAAGSFMLFLR